MTSRLAFVSLEPDAHLSALVMEYKRRVRKLAGDQLYLSDPPHTTLYLAPFEDLDVVFGSLSRVASMMPAIGVSLEGWKAFPNDALTGNHTLVCQFSEASRRAAQSVQSAVISALAPLRDKSACEARYQDRWESLSEVQQQSVLSCGFPYSGKDWHPHLTIASIKRSDWDLVYSALKKSPPIRTGVAFSLKIYELVDGKPKPLMRSPLQIVSQAA
jgi:2'-5' RNA ligase